ncbi:unnamed protein product [Tenebrio molitor]|nr:unnamed protein product [Tenebrio molitor]
MHKNTYTSTGAEKLHRSVEVSCLYRCDWSRRRGVKEAFGWLLSQHSCRDFTTTVDTLASSKLLHLSKLALIE